MHAVALITKSPIGYVAYVAIEINTLIHTRVTILSIMIAKEFEIDVIAK